MADHSHFCVRPARRAFIAAMAALPVVVFAETAMGAGRPRRIICAGGDVCEIVYALGFGASIIAGDLASRYTPGSERFAKLGRVDIHSFQDVGFVIQAACWYGGSKDGTAGTERRTLEPDRAAFAWQGE